VQIVLNGFGRVVDIKTDDNTNEDIQKAINNGINDYLGFLESLYSYKGDMDIFDILNIITKGFDKQKP
jgi:hypothetical protein